MVRGMGLRDPGTWVMIPKAGKDGDCSCTTRIYYYVFNS